jgi:hypothetical protein
MHRTVFIVVSYFEMNFSNVFGGYLINIGSFLVVDRDKTLFWNEVTDENQLRISIGNFLKVRNMKKGPEVTITQSERVKFDG